MEQENGWSCLETPRRTAQYYNKSMIEENKITGCSRNSFIGEIINVAKVKTFRELKMKTSNQSE